MSEEYFSDSDPDFTDDEIEETTTSSETVFQKIEACDMTMLPRMSNYEFSRAIETRASQIDNGSLVSYKLFEEIEEKKITNSIDIAKLEIERGLCPLILGKKKTATNQLEHHHTNQLEQIDCGLNDKYNNPASKIGELSIEEIINYKTATPILNKFAEQKDEKFQNDKKAGRIKFPTGN